MFYFHGHFVTHSARDRRVALDVRHDSITLLVPTLCMYCLRNGSDIQALALKQVSLCMFALPCTALVPTQFLMSVSTVISEAQCTISPIRAIPAKPVSCPCDVNVVDMYIREMRCQRRTCVTATAVIALRGCELRHH